MSHRNLQQGGRNEQATVIASAEERFTALVVDGPGYSWCGSTRPYGAHHRIIASLSYAESHRPTVGDAINASGKYYQAIQRHDYTSAYNSLDRNATITVHSRPVLLNSVDTLATASKALDTQDGMISSYTVTNGNFEQGRNIVDLTMKVTRTGQPYDVHLKLELASRDWKILSADGV